MSSLVRSISAVAPRAVAAPNCAATARMMPASAGSSASARSASVCMAAAIAWVAAGTSPRALERQRARQAVTHRAEPRRRGRADHDRELVESGEQHLEDRRWLQFVPHVL